MFVESWRFCLFISLNLEIWPLSDGRRHSDRGDGREKFGSSLPAIIGDPLLQKQLHEIDACEPRQRFFPCSLVSFPSIPVNIYILKKCPLIYLYKF